MDRVPELPEVETMRRAVAGVAGSRVTAVTCPPCEKRALRIEPGLPELRRRMAGRTVREVARAGKRVVLVLDSQDRLVIEPRMTGLVLLADPPTHEHLRLVIELAGGPARELLYWDRRGLGVVSLLGPAEFEARCGAARLGPDALGIGADVLRERLSPSARPIKVALLDQSALAGVGNIYASEALHLARLHPLRPCAGLGKPEWTRLAAALNQVLEAAVLAEGSDLGDGTYRSALEGAGFQSQHRVYGRERERCPTCKRGAIRRVVLAQRATFFCAVCQRPPRAP